MRFFKKEPSCPFCGTILSPKHKEMVNTKKKDSNVTMLILQNDICHNCLCYLR